MGKWKYILGILGLGVVATWIAVFSVPKKENLYLIACDVGQGDGHLIMMGDIQIVVDGGPGNKIIDCLSKHMPYWDREIELVVLTHPQNDHYGGLIEVVRQYDVEAFVGSGVDNNTQGYELLKEEVRGRGIEVINPEEGMKMGLGKMYLDILNPRRALASAGRQASGVLGAFSTDEDLNTFSVVFKLSYGDFDALYTGDIGPNEIDSIISRADIGEIVYLKVPHHGSKNGLAEELLKETEPEAAVISVGKNQWGHPHKEILDMLDKYNIKVYRTDIEGDVVIVTNGKEYWVKD